MSSMQPYTVEDRKEFMNKLIRRKGDLFRNEQFEIVQCRKGLVKGRDKVLLKVEINEGKYYYQEHTLSYLFDEFEFITGEPFGK